MGRTSISKHLRTEPRVSRASRSSSAESSRFNQLIAELSTVFVRVPTAEIDAEINRSLKRIVETLGLDRSTIAEIGSDDGVATFTHGWERDGHYGIIGKSLDANTLLPWTKEKMIAGETVVMPSVQQLPEEAAVDRDSFRLFGPKSSVMISIKVEGLVVAAVGFGVLYQERRWPPKVVEQLQMMATIFGYAFERKRAVKEMVRLQRELTYVARVNTMGELAASVAHELNQPLGAILNNAEAIQSMLESEHPDFVEIKAGVADIIQDDVRAGDTIRPLRALFRRDDFAKSTLDLGAVLREINRIVQSDAVIRNVSFSLELPDSLPAVQADRIQVQQAIINLILNAFDAVGEIARGPRKVTLAATAHEGCVKLLVADSGKEIEPATMCRIFERFFTTKPSGMGMGLAISRSIIEAHGGQLTVSSEVGRGSTFEITLPNQP